ncbi:MAG TPA: Gfo/Idh/MocA family oxidoreductase [Symbiobacteriaceae bacterium]|nr:Gfo/Idh/MocA family oxidoreductase [Symbiobacteriaceae bacterium]
MQERPQVGVIGAGRWGQNLVRTFHALQALGGVAEANPALHERIAADVPGVPLYLDYRELLGAPIPAVVIATPVPSHYELARAALLAGKDVFVEKPLALKSAEAEALVALAEAQGRLLLVGHLLLFQPAMPFIKAYLESGQLGRVVSLHQERLNLGTARSVENALWSLGVHDVAVQLYLLGAAPDQIAATGQAVLQVGIEDDLHLHLRFPNGAQAHLHAAWLWPEKRRRLVVIGTEGMLSFDEGEQSVTLHRKRITPALRHHDAGSEVLFRGGGAPLTSEAEHFIAAVQSQTRSALIDGAHGAQVVRVLEAATRALKGGQGHAGSAPGSERADRASGR